MKEVICTCCPQGCHLQVDEANDYKVTGNGCPNGIAYGKEELTHPTRIITSTVRAEGCLHSRCPVKTSKPVPKGQMAEVVAALDSVVLHAPIHVGDVVLTDVCGTGADHCDLPRYGINSPFTPTAFFNLPIHNTINKAAAAPCRAAAALRVRKFPCVNTIWNALR